VNPHAGVLGDPRLAAGRSCAAQGLPRLALRDVETRAFGAYAAQHQRVLADFLSGRSADCIDCRQGKLLETTPSPTPVPPSSPVTPEAAAEALLNLQVEDTPAEKAAQNGLFSGSSELFRSCSGLFCLPSLAWLAVCGGPLQISGVAGTGPPSWSCCSSGCPAPAAKVAGSSGR